MYYRCIYIYNTNVFTRHVITRVRHMQYRCSTHVLQVYMSYMFNKPKTAIMYYMCSTFPSVPGHLGGSAGDHVLSP